MLSGVPVSRRHVMKLAQFANAMLWVQLINALTGVWIVRALPVQEYAIFTVLVTGSAAINTLGNAGIVASLTSIAGRCWGDKAAVRGAFHYLRNYQWRMFALMLVFVVPGFFLLLTSVGAHVAYSGYGVAAGVLIALILILSELHLVILRLSGNTRLIGRLSIGQSLVRAAVVLVASWLWKDPTVLFLAVLPGVVWQMLQLRAATTGTLNGPSLLPPDTPKVTRSLVGRALPNNLFFVFQGQITTWLLALLGSPTSVAGLGALGRFLALTFIVEKTIQNAIAPYFARQQTRVALRRVLLAALGVALFLPLIFLVIAYAYPGIPLWILGQNYSGLSVALQWFSWLMVVRVAIVSVQLLCRARGWLLPPVISISSSLTFFALGAALFNISTLVGVIQLGLLSSSGGLLVWCIYIQRKLRAVPSGERPLPASVDSQ